jgi:hypothetical protein
MPLLQSRSYPDAQLSLRCPFRRLRTPLSWLLLELLHQLVRLYYGSEGLLSLGSM